MAGFITEKDLEQADGETEFRGIRDFWLALKLEDRPVTFLELVYMFMRRPMSIGGVS